jgi:hypothetical protein
MIGSLSQLHSTRTAAGENHIKGRKNADKNMSPLLCVTCVTATFQSKYFIGEVFI